MSSKYGWIVKNLFWAAVFVVGFSLICNLILRVVTQHDKLVAVPDFSNISVAEATQLAAQNSLRVEVSDSVYVRRMKRGAVFSQIPKPGTLVKDNRKVRLNINAITAKKVSMPNLVGLSLRQAKAELSSRGLYLGKIVYVNDMATNNVLKQLYKNSEIRPGRMIESGSTLVLMVGLNESDNMTMVPDVVGMRYLRAADAIQDNSLNVGRLRFDASVKTYNDSLNAVVISQNPVSSEVAEHMGSDVSLSLSLDPAKISALK